MAPGRRLKLAVEPGLKQVEWSEHTREAGKGDPLGLPLRYWQFFTIPNLPRGRDDTHFGAEREEGRTGGRG